MQFFRNPVILSHHLVEEVLKPGDRAIDATAGNGHDTLFLAKLVGQEGEVYAFDQQPLAIQRTAQRIKDAKVAARVYLINAGHEKMKDYVEGKFRTIMFNLGYLPGSGKQFATKPETTRLALQQSLDLLAPGGVLTVVVYVGHSGAIEEQRVVEDWAASLPQDKWVVVRCDYPNRNNSPYLILVQPHER